MRVALALFAVSHQKYLSAGSTLQCSIFRSKSIHRKIKYEKGYEMQRNAPAFHNLFMIEVENILEVPEAYFCDCSWYLVFRPLPT